VESCEELLKLPSIQSLDLKNNQIDDRDKVIPFFSQMQQIHALYLKGNPCVRFISNYRKTLTQKLTQLNYLDDRPIFEHERIVANAFVRGGIEEEKKVREQMAQEKADKLRRTMEHGRKHTEEGKARRKEALKQMLSELKDEKEELIKKREGLKAEYRAMPDSDP
jgi:dynein assembly factor 1, axonemal